MLIAKRKKSRRAHGPAIVKDGRSYVDANRNRADFAYFGSESRAKAALLSLVNCEACTNCRECKNCYACSDCVNCVNCDYCVDCRSCKQCKRTKSSSVCRSVDDSAGCDECVFCQHLTSCSCCRCCNNSRDCSHCEYCAECRKCESCEHCQNCERCTESQGLMSCQHCHACTNCYSTSHLIRCKLVFLARDRVDVSFVVLGCPKVDEAFMRRRVPMVENLHQTVAATIKTQPKKCFDMQYWHNKEHDTDEACFTSHCWAGWIVQLAGNAGKLLEAMFEPSPSLQTMIAACLIVQRSCPEIPLMLPWFFDKKKARARIYRCGVEADKLQERKNCAKAKASTKA